MNNIGVIYDISNDKAVILTQSSNFIMIRRREDMFLGQQITFDEKDIYKPGKYIYRYISAAASVAAAFVLVFVFLNMVHGNVFGYVTVDINPSMEFSIDKDYKVLEAVALNEDAAKLLESMETKNESIESVVIEMIKKSKNYGFIKSEEKTNILVSAALSEKKKEYGTDKDTDFSKLDTLLNEIKKEMEGQDSNIIGNILRVTSEERKAAKKHNISMGKYYLFLKAREQGLDISIDKLHNMKVSELIKGIEAEGLSAQTVAKGPKYSPLTTSVQLQTPAPSFSSKQTVRTEYTPVIPPEQIKNLISSIPSAPNFSGRNTAGASAKITDMPHIVPILTPSNLTTAQNSKQNSENLLKLKHYSEDHNASTQGIHWDFVIENIGTDTINMKNVKVRYYFKEEVDKVINSMVYFYSIGDEKADVNGKVYKINETDYANRYLEVTFDKGSISPGKTAWVFGEMSREDWSKFSQKDDYSFNPTATGFSEWNKMTVYVSNKLVWGMEPD